MREGRGSYAATEAVHSRVSSPCDYRGIFSGPIDQKKVVSNCPKVEKPNC